MALALSRSGVAAAGIPAAARFGQAADFYSLFGVNIHWKRPGSPYANVANTVTDLVALGIRHVRETATGSFFDTTFWYFREGHKALHAHNLALGAGQQPIFVSVIVPGHPGYQPFTHNPANTGGPGWTVDDWYDIFDGGRQHRDGAYNLVPNGVTGGGSTPNPWAIAEPELPWAVVDSFEATNEPNGTAMGNLRAWVQELTDDRDDRAAVVVSSLPVITENGIVSGITVDQLPIVGPSIRTVPDSNAVGDWTTSPPCDCGDAHPYQPGMEPSVEFMNTEVLQGATSGWANGGLRTPADHSASLPFFITEGAGSYISRGSNSMETAVAGSSHSGYWPAPDDVIAEYMVRHLVLCYRLGIRRTYIYELYDAFNDAVEVEYNFGLLKSDRTKKQQFYSLRNLLSLVGFTEAPTLAKGPIPYTVSGFTAQGMNGGGSGLNKHLGMFSGNGDFGVTGAGQVYHQNADRLDTILLQQDASTYVLILTRQVALWDREVGNWNTTTDEPQVFGNTAAGRFTPNTQTITINFPDGVTEVREATPTAGGTTTPNDGKTWSAPKTISGGTQVTVSMQGKTKLLKVTLATSDTLPSELPVQPVTTEGLAPGYSTADEDGHSFDTGARVFLHIKNAGAVPTVATIQVPYAPFEEFAVTPLTATVNAGQTKLLGPFPQRYFGQQVELDLSATTGVTLGAFELQRS